MSVARQTKKNEPDRFGDRGDSEAPIYFRRQRIAQAYDAGDAAAEHGERLERLRRERFDRDNEGDRFE